MKFLITGIPGTGKTTIGHYLEQEKEYEHFDIEAIFKKHGNSGLQLLEEFISKQGKKKVMTWGFIPKEHDAQVKELQNLGYQMIWFDGNRDAARREFVRRGTVPQHLFDLQLNKISEMDINEFNPRIVNTFNDKGEFLPKDKIVELLEEPLKVR